MVIRAGSEPAQSSAPGCDGGGHPQERLMQRLSAGRGGRKSSAITARLPRLRALKNRPNVFQLHGPQIKICNDVHNREGRMLHASRRNR